MLRLIVLVLVLANGVYFAWRDGWLHAYGFGPTAQREPQRMVQQIKPESLRILSTPEIKRVEAQVQADLAPKECLQAGPFDDAQAVVLRRALESGLGGTGWQIDAVVVPARWIIYMGKFANAEALAKKRGELRTMSITPQNVTTAPLEMGLSLGGFEDQAAATAELARLAQRGIRTARVVQERQESRLSQLKVPAATEATKQRLNEFKQALAGRALVTCK
jgi:hypothetical protein